MRAYIPFNELNFDYPDEMQKILVFLRKRGVLQVSEKTVERLYREFSDTRCAGWLIVGEETLVDFAEWLSEVNI